MKPLLIITFCVGLWLNGLSNINKPYASSKQGVTIFLVGGWDSIAVQKIVDDDLNFILESIDKPQELKIFIILGDYGLRTQWRSKTPQIFISAAFDSLSKTDTIYNEDFDIKYLAWLSLKQKFNPLNYSRPNDMYPGSWPPLAHYLKGTQGLKISYYDIWDTVNYYNHLLSVVDYAIKHIEEIKKEQLRMCFPAYLHDWEISILTYDTTKLKAIPIEDWGFTVDPYKRHHKSKPVRVIYAILSVLLLTFFLLVLRKQLFQKAISAPTAH